MNIIDRLITRNFTAGRGKNTITGIVLHTEGVPPTTKINSRDDRSLFNWFQTNTAGVSSHYYVTFSGKIERYVKESDTAHHAQGDGNQNVQTIGIEHQDNGYWEEGRENRYTDAQYEASAQLVADICKKYNIPCKEQVHGIRPHRAIDPKACPGAMDYRRIIRRANEILTPPAPKPPVETEEVKKLKETNAALTAENAQLKGQIDTIKKAFVNIGFITK